MIYCDECARACDGTYHELSDCPECGGEFTVSVGPAGPHPEAGDEWFCDTCGANGEA